MNDWFEINKIDTNTYVIQENKHWEKANCYLLLGDKFAVLIDTGMGISNIEKEILSITELPIMVLTTHVHWDHIGGHKYFDNFGVHKCELEWISERFPIPVDIVKSNIMRDDIEFPEMFNIEKYSIFNGTPSFIQKEGDIIDLGNRKLKIIHTPGHSPGHCCFYDMDKKYLFFGDLVYKGCLDMFYESTNPFHFLNSIKILESLDIQKILPGHYDLNIDVEIINKIDNALTGLLNMKSKGYVKGLYKFEDFEIRL